MDEEQLHAIEFCSAFSIQQAASASNKTLD